MADLSTLVLRVDGTQGTRALDQYDKAAQRADRSSRLLDEATAKLTKAFALLGGAAAVRELVAVADSMALLQSRLRLATSSTAEYVDVQRRLFDVAQRTRQGLEDTVNLYTRVARSADELGLSQADVIRLTETVNQSLVVSGATAASASGALTQLAQAFGAGVVRAEEFNSILEGAPRLAQAAAQSLGLTVGQLRTLVNEGGLTSRALADALLRNQTIAKEFSGVQTTVAQSIVQVRNALADAIGRADASTGSTQALAAALTQLAGAIRENQGAFTVFLRELNNVGAAAVGIVKVFRELGVAVDDIGRYIDGVAKAVEGLATFSPSAWVEGIRRMDRANADYASTLQRIKDLFADGRLREQMSRAPVISTEGRNFLQGLTGPQQLTAQPFGMFGTDALRQSASVKAAAMAITAAQQTVTQSSEELKRKQQELADALEKTAFSGGLARQNALENAVALRQFVEPVKLSYGEVQKLIQAQERAAGAAKAQANAVRLGIADTAEYKAEVMTATQVEDLRTRGIELTVEQLERLKQANLDIARAQRANPPAKPIQELDSALVSVSGTLRDISQALNGTGNDAVRMLGVLASALDGLAKAQQRARQLAESGQTLSGGQKLATAVGGAIGAFGSGYAVGSTTTSRTAGVVGGALAGAASGAATGAALGASGGPLAAITAPVGAVIGALIGGIGGLLGASKNATQQLIAQRAAQEQLNEALASLRASFSNDALSGAIAQASAQFSQLRQQTEAAFSGRKNEAERNKILRELNVLEAKRIELIRAEYAESQRRLQQDFEVRRLRAEGSIAEADALAFSAQQERELADLRKSGADAATIAAAQETLLAEARRRQAEIAETERRAIFDLTNGARGFADPRGAADAAFAEEQQRRYADAVARGASAAELAAIAFFNLAEAIDRAAQIAEQDRRTREGLTVRGFAALGMTREAEDAALAAGQRQELADAIRAGMSPSNLALLQFVQFAEREQAALRRVIEDGTKAIQEAAAQQIAALDAQIAAEEARAAEEAAAITAQITAIRDAATVATTAIDTEISGLQSALDAQLTAIDAQRDAVSALLQVQRAALQTAESQLTVARSAFDALTEFGRSLLVSEAAGASPLDRLAAASARFDELRALAAGGDAGAAQALPEAARALLEASKGVNASGAGFQRDFARVQEAVATLGRQFGGETDRLTAQVESLRQLVASSEAQVATLETLRDTLRDSTGAQIDALRAQKEALAEATRQQIAKLEEQREGVRFASEVIVEALKAQREQVQRDADRQIAELIKVQTEAFTARVEASDYYRAWREATETQGEATAEYQDTSAALLARMDERAAEAALERQAQTASLKELVTSQARQIVTLQAQIRTTVEIGQATVSELAQLREQVAQGNSLTRRAAEGASL